MKKVAVFDIEATNWIDFACLGFFDGEDYRVYWGIEHFLEDLLTKKYKGWTIYAHFGGKYDFRFLIPALVDHGGYELTFVERASKILSIKIRCKKTKATWKLSDSFFLLPKSLKELGKNFQIKYMKLDFDVETEKDFKSEKAQAYLKNDCLGLYEILEKFSNWGLNGGQLKITLPSQAMHVFTKNFLDEKLYPVNREVEDFIRKTYFGGRVEIFKMYGENLNYYDVNSLYPAMMLKDMPCGAAVETLEFHKDKIGFYQIDAVIPEKLHIPPLPTIVKEKLFFPVGRGEFYVTSADLELLTALKIKFTIKKGVVFTKKKAIFKGFIEAMWKIRQSFPKGSMDNEIAKLLMNSTYGKTGMKRENEELIFSDKPEIGWRVYDEDFGLYTRDTESRSPFILPYLASYITSLARNELYRLMIKAGFENVYYCDTDSIITSTKMPTGEGLGALKLEYRIKEAVFLQPKAYAFVAHTPEGEKHVIKVKGMKEIKIGIEEFKKSLKTKDMSLIKTEYKTIIGFRQSLRENKSLKITRKTICKKLNFLYNKRVINGIETQPKNFNNI